MNEEGQVGERVKGTRAMSSVCVYLYASSSQHWAQCSAVWYRRILIWTWNCCHGHTMNGFLLSFSVNNLLIIQEFGLDIHVVSWDNFCFEIMFLNKMDFWSFLYCHTSKFQLEKCNMLTVFQHFNLPSINYISEASLAVTNQIRPVDTGSFLFRQRITTYFAKRSL